MRCSRSVSRGNSASCCGQKPRSWRSRSRPSASAKGPSVRIPKKLALPPSGAIAPVIIDMVVVLPAPL